MLFVAAMAYKQQPRFSGFTIVELLIVIVVIGILAAITIVAYNGVQQRAVAASLTSDLDNAAKLLKLDQVINSAYPTTLALANSGKGVPASSGTTYQYTVTNSASPQTFCITATKGTTSYKITNDSTPSVGVCLEYGLVTSLDAATPASYSGAGTTWTDLSSNGSNGTLVNGVGYSSANSGALTFNGTNQYISTSSAPSPTSAGSLSAWVYVNSLGGAYSSIIFKGPGVSWNDIDYGLLRNGSSNTFLGTLNNGTNNLAGAGPNSSVITAGQWYNLVFTWDSTVTKFYTNNIQTGSVNYSNGAGARSTNMNVGSAVGGANYFFNGSIPNVRIYNRALSADEVSQNFNALRGRYGI